jgi:hypothetical protein
MGFVLNIRTQNGINPALIPFAALAKIFQQVFVNPHMFVFYLKMTQDARSQPRK